MIDTLSFKIGLVGVVIGLIGIIIALIFGLKQKSAKKVMGVFVNSIQNQTQSVCTSLQDIKDKQGSNIEWLKGKIEGTFDNLAALNGTIIDFYNKFYKKKPKRGNKMGRLHRSGLPASK